MLTTGIFPDSFKISKITPLFGGVSMLSNYRQNSILPTISKIFEEFYIINYINNWLAEQQYGFCTNHFAGYAAVKRVNNVSTEMELNGHTPAALYYIMICLKRLIHYHLTSYYIT